VFISLRYHAQDEKESEHICERVVPQLQHANGGVVLSAVKVRVDRTESLKAILGEATNSTSR